MSSFHSGEIYARTIDTKGSLSTMYHNQGFVWKAGSGVRIRFLLVKKTWSWLLLLSVKGDRDVIWRGTEVIFVLACYRRTHAHEDVSVLRIRMENWLKLIVLGEYYRFKGILKPRPPIHTITVASVSSPRISHRY